MAEHGISTSTYGLGRLFIQDLMIDMARAGGGNAYYGQAAEDLMEPFLQEFDFMTALCGRHLRLGIEPAPRVMPDVINRYPKDADGRVMLPGLGQGAEAWALLRLDVSPHFSAGRIANAVHLLSVKLKYRDSEDRTEFACPIQLRLPCLPAEAFAGVVSDELVTRRLAELRAAALQEEARDAARRRDWTEVRRLIAELRAEAMHSPWLAASLAELEAYAEARHAERFSKETSYKADAMHSRLASPTESRDWQLDDEALGLSFLRKIHTPT